MSTRAPAWDSAATAVFLGASIHEAAQVVGAAFALSPEHGELATLTKLLRVALLAPVVMALRWRFMRGDTAAGSFVSWPQPLVDTAAQLSRLCLLTAIAAVGLLTHAGSLLRLGWRPVVLMVALTLVIALVAALGVTAGALL